MKTPQPSTLPTKGTKLEYTRRIDNLMLNEAETNRPAGFSAGRLSFNPFDSSLLTGPPDQSKVGKIQEVTSRGMY
jgi:hypothetical protein